jgi:acyl carrier protein
MNDLESIRLLLRELLMRSGDTEPFTDEETLFSGGRLQSIDGVEMVVFLEEKFGVDFAKLGFDQSAIDSVDNIARLLDRR